MATSFPQKLLNFSFYYNQRNWHVLVKKHIGKIVGLATEFDAGILYTICLSHYCGDNIQLNVLASASVESKIINLVDKETKIFFKKRPSASKKIGYPLNSFFKNFPVNSIQYNLKSKSAMGSFAAGGSINAGVGSTINNIIVTHLSKNEITEEAVFITVYYLHLIIIKVLLSHYPKDLLLIFAEANKKVQDAGERARVLAENLLAENEPIFADIFEHILLNPSLFENKENLWMTEWMEACTAFLKAGAGDGWGKIGKWEYLVAAINTQLSCGFEDIQFFMLRFIIEKLPIASN